MNNTVNEVISPTVIHNSKYIISFDIGIKHLCFCILKTEPRLDIVDWNIINLMEDPQQQLMNILPPCHACSRKSVYKKKNQYFCKQHAKKTNWILPHRQFSKGSLRKKTKADLITFCHLHLYFIDHTTKQPLSNLPKTDLVDSADKFFQDKMLEPASLESGDDQNAKKSNIHAGNMDLIQLGRNMKKHLDKIPIVIFDLIGYVIIENQISTIATRMKTIQGMLTQYFIMRSTENVEIEYISSQNKLKYFSKCNIIPLSIETEPDNTIDFTTTQQTITTTQQTITTTDKKNKYKENKKNGILYCSQLLNKYSYLEKDWLWTMKMTKKDDYADSFLQGFWFLQKKRFVL